jgi:hypothetical protein
MQKRVEGEEQTHRVEGEVQTHQPCQKKAVIIGVMYAENEKENWQIS